MKMPLLALISLSLMSTLAQAKDNAALKAEIKTAMQNQMYASCGPVVENQYGSLKDVRTSDQENFEECERNIARRLFYKQIPEKIAYLESALNRMAQKSPHNAILQLDLETLDNEKNEHANVSFKIEAEMIRGPKVQNVLSSFVTLAILEAKYKRLLKD